MCDTVGGCACCVRHCSDFGQSVILSVFRQSHTHGLGGVGSQFKETAFARAHESLFFRSRQHRKEGVVVARRIEYNNRAAEKSELTPREHLAKLVKSADAARKSYDAAGEAGIPIRIGVNAGSLDPAVDAREDLTQPEKLVESALSFVRHFEGRGFPDIVLSAKTHSVPSTIRTNRELSARIPTVPLHLGVTEAGGLGPATVKNSVALGVLLSEGIGDTVRVSITAPPEEEVRVAWNILQSVGLRRRGPEIVSCPTCGRCRIDLMGLASQVEERLRGVEAPITVAVMGCVVNGPGEARAADIGIAGGDGQGLLIAGGESLGSVPEGRLVDALMEEIDRRYGDGPRP